MIEMRFLGALLLYLCRAHTHTQLWLWIDARQEWVATPNATKIEQLNTSCQPNKAEPSLRL